MVEISIGNHRTGVAGAPNVTTLEAAKLVEATRYLDSILSRNNKCLKVAVKDWSITLGDTTGEFDFVEMSFNSYSDCVIALSECRIYKFAQLCFAGKLHLKGSVDSIVDIFYDIDMNVSYPQSGYERFISFLNKQLLSRIPYLSKNFPSNIHYSLDARAYELFLDPYLQYTCSKTSPWTKSLEDAQIEKFDLITRWANLKLGHLGDRRHLDIGCGWGGLIAYFSEMYGTNSVGITNSCAQRDYISSKYGYKTILGDFSKIREMEGSFDLVTVVGMSEHVVGTRKNTLLNLINRALNDDGVLYFQSITKPDQWIGGDAYRVAQEMIFPGHDLDFQYEMEDRFTRAGFRILCSEDGTKDYAYTTGQWSKNVKRNFVDIENLIGPDKANMFLLYLAYASKLFANKRGRLMRYALVKQSIR